MTCRFEAVVFDLGGVIIDWDPDHLYRKLISDEQERSRFLTEVCSPEWNHTMDLGLDPEEAVAELARRHPDEIELIRAWSSRWSEMLDGEIPGTRDLATRLKNEGTPIYALTNWSQHTWPRATLRYPFLNDLFDGVVMSGDEGVAKPDPAIFEILVSRYGIEPATTAFVDDQARNIAAAEALGFHPHQFRDAAVLEVWLYS